MTAIPDNPAPDFLFLTGKERPPCAECGRPAIIWVDDYGFLCYVPESVCL